MQSDDWKASSGDKCSAAKPQCPAGFYCYNDACVGKMRPTHVEGLICAWDLVAKAIEHKALGIDASFAFLLFCEHTIRGLLASRTVRVAV